MLLKMQQAHSAIYDDKIIGNSLNTVVQFLSGKNLKAYGEGGAIVTNDYNIAKKLE